MTYIAVIDTMEGSFRTTGETKAEALQRLQEAVLDGYEDDHTIGEVIGDIEKHGDDLIFGGIS